MIETIHKDEIKRNRSRVTEINNLLDHYRDEIENFESNFNAWKKCIGGSVFEGSLCVSIPCSWRSSSGDEEYLFLSNSTSRCGKYSWGVPEK